MNSEDWIDEVDVNENAMQLIHRAVDKLRTLKFQADQAQAQAENALKTYNDEVIKVAELFRSNGMESLKCEDGVELTVVEKIRCSLKKDVASQAQIAKWLRDNQMDNLVKAQLIVMPSAKEILDKMGVAYDEKVDMNTNSVKAFIRSEMEKGNMAPSDIPSGISWYMYDDMEIKV